MDLTDATGTLYSIHGIDSTCYTFPAGAKVRAKTYTKWGTPFFDIAWVDKKGKIKVCGYAVSNVRKIRDFRCV